MSSLDKQTPPPQQSFDFLFRGTTGTLAAQCDRHGPWMLEVHQIWCETVIQSAHFGQQQRTITLGEGQGCDFLAAEGTIGTESHPLFVRKGNDFYLDVHLGWAVFELANPDGRGEDRPLTGKAGLIPISEGMLYRLEVGEVSFLARLVKPPRPFLSPFSVSLDGLFIGMLGISMFCGFLFGLLVLMLPGNPELQGVEVEERFAHLALAHLRQSSATQHMVESPTRPAAKKSESSPKRSKDTAVAPRPSGPAKQRISMTRSVDSMVGFPGWNQSMDDGVSSLNERVSEHLKGIRRSPGGRGPGVGTDPLGNRSDGFGDGGTGEVEGIADIGPRGGGPSNGSSSLCGQDEVCEKKSGKLSLDTAGMVTVGSMDRSQVEEVIRRHMQGIRYCYQRNLQQQPDLAGKVVTRFVIAGDGNVSVARTSRTTIHHAGVERCVEDRFRRMRFPKPSGGGLVVVNYPVHFSTR